MKQVETRHTTTQETKTNPGYVFMRIGPVAIAGAGEMALQANHYNRIRVGAMLLAANGEGDLKVFDGANQNLRPGPNPSKVCAEQVAGQKAVSQGYNLPIGLWVRGGPVQAHTHSGLITPTMHVCGNCEHILSNDPRLINNPDMAIVTVHPDEDSYEAYTLDELRRLHQGDDVDIRHFVDPGFVNWDKATTDLEQHLLSQSPVHPVSVGQTVLQALSGELAAA